MKNMCKIFQILWHVCCFFILFTSFSILQSWVGATSLHHPSQPPPTPQNHPPKEKTKQTVACVWRLLWSKRLINVRQAISVSGLRWSRTCRHHVNGESGPESTTCFLGETYNLKGAKEKAHRREKLNIILPVKDFSKCKVESYKTWIRLELIWCVLNIKYDRTENLQFTERFSANRRRRRNNQVDLIQSNQNRHFITGYLLSSFISFIPTKQTSLEWATPTGRQTIQENTCKIKELLDYFDWLYFSSYI